MHKLVLLAKEKQYDRFHPDWFKNHKLNNKSCKEAEQEALKLI